ncbi:MAG: fumarylacetoacetate hydrolase family protein [Candidatus Thermoplasmatota archaeon]|nr:fumarylacetoacetate hydrolase family protein [Candidatus Thermoplasmatota archaeon]
MVQVRLGNGHYELRPTKIICLLRSYAAHATELGNEVPGRPQFFLKPPSALVPNRSSIVVPPGVGRLHHEIELSVVISRKGRNISEDIAMDHVEIYLPMLDITARDLQDAAKSKGLPWSEAKGYDTFAPVGPEAVRSSDHDWRGKRIWLEVNGQIRQDSNTDMLLFSVERMISDISKVMTLEPGDIIMTGTPPGVGPLLPGDRIRAGIDGMEPMEFDVVRQ